MKIAEMKFPNFEGVYKTQVSDDNIKLGDSVIVNNGQVAELGNVFNIKDTNKTENSESEWKFVRIANEKDIKKFNELQEKSKEYLDVCQDKIKKHDLEAMKLLEAKLSFDEKKLTYYFRAESRVDFRELVSDLAKTFRKIIRLQQIGSRDEAKILSGVGKCGRVYCCSTFLNKMESITLDDAKAQDISFGVSKLSGACGKLMCCLLYELEEYKKLGEKMPKVGDEIKIKKEKCWVVARNLIKQTYLVENENGQRNEVEL